MKKLVFFSLLAFAACGACQKMLVQPPSIYSQLVDGGCLAATDGGLEAVQELAASDAAPSWFTCLQGGGNITTCQVPCTVTSKPLNK